MMGIASMAGEPIRPLSGGLSMAVLGAWLWIEIPIIARAG